MAGLLDGGLAGSIYSSFKGRLLKGVIVQHALAPGAALDGHGDPTATVPKTTRLEGFSEGYSRFTRAQAGIPGTDVKVSIFSASMKGVEPAIGNQVRLDRKLAGGKTESRWYEIKGPIDIDPAGVLWECQASVIRAPAL